MKRRRLSRHDQGIALALLVVVILGAIAIGWIFAFIIDALTGLVAVAQDY